MLKITIALALFGVCLCAEEPVPILNEENVVQHDGQYHYKYETGDGIKAEERGELKTVGSESAPSVAGIYSYTAPDGQSIVVQYEADENGYRPVGEHIPKIPEIIARAIEFNKAHPQVETVRGKTRV